MYIVSAPESACSKNARGVRDLITARAAVYRRVISLLLALAAQQGTRPLGGGAGGCAHCSGAREAKSNNRGEQKVGETGSETVKTHRRPRGQNCISTMEE